jgi:NAD+ synthetase
MDWKIVAKNIRTELKNYIVKNNLRSLVVGVSGGIDSALCCVLAKPICDELNISLIGRSLSIISNKKEEFDRARTIGISFCTNFREIDLSEQYISFVKLNSAEGVEENTIKEKIRNGNIKARCRMIYLYNLSQLHNGLVLSTDNFSEYQVAFWTQHGDVGDYGMIQNLWKTEVYLLAKYIVDFELTNNYQKDALLSCIYAIPTDGLGITNSDFEQLTVNSYEEADIILKEHLIDKSKYIDHPIIKRHYATEFKRKVPINLKRSVILKNA